MRSKLIDSKTHHSTAWLVVRNIATLPEFPIVGTLKLKNKTPESPSMNMQCYWR